MPRSKPPGDGEQELDMITEAEIPEYQADIQQLVTAIHQDPQLAERVQGIGHAAVKLAFVVVDPRVKRTVVEYCRVAGVDRSTYYYSIRNPKWVAFKNQLAKKFTEDVYSDAVVALRQLIRLGDVKAIRLFFELRGDLVQRTESTVVQETAEERMKRIRAQQSLRDGSLAPVAPADAPGAENQVDAPLATVGNSREEVPVEERLQRARQLLDGEGDITK